MFVWKENVLEGKSFVLLFFLHFLFKPWPLIGALLNILNTCDGHPFD